MIVKSKEADTDCSVDLLTGALRTCCHAMTSSELLYRTKIDRIVLLVPDPVGKLAEIRVTL